MLFLSPVEDLKTLRKIGSYLQGHPNMNETPGVDMPVSYTHLDVYKRQALYGIFTVITYYSGFRAGFCFSAGATDLVFSASLPAAAKTWMIIPLGIAAFVVFYAVFYFAITKFDLKDVYKRQADDTGSTSGLDSLLVHLGVILDLKAQTGCAVTHFLHVAVYKRQVRRISVHSIK